MLALRDRLGVLRDRRGFTMVEMMVVLIIIAVLIAGGIFYYLKYIDRAKVTRARGELNTMAAALDAYYAENGAYPADEGEAVSKAGLPQDPAASGNLVKNPWGVKYSYTYDSGTGKYTLTANDGTKDRVRAEGSKGISTITTL